VSDYDSPWKEALDHFFALFLAFFFPEIFADIDWSVDYEALDQELQKLAPEGEVGRRHADKLVKAATKGPGDPLYLHVEVQCWEEANFEGRVHRYNYRIEDRTGSFPVSLVVLGDDNPDWRPGEYVAERYGCRRTLHFDPVKLLDWAGREEELEKDANPFALMVIAHLQALATRDDPEARAAWKLRLIKGLYERRLDGEDVRQWFRCFDWLLNLPPELERRVWEEVSKMEREKQTPYITSVERIGMEKGQREMLLENIELVLKIKFGQAGLDLLPALQQQPDVTVLRGVMRAAVEGASSPEDLRKLLGPTNGAAAPPA
jgi:hypothetical protein